MPTTQKLHQIDLTAKINRQKTCFFTGHRILPQPIITELAGKLHTTLPRIIEKGFDTFLSGGALGFDLLAAETVLRLRNRYPRLRLIFALPCLDHAAKWRQEDQYRFKTLLEQAGESVCLYAYYHQNCMKERNRFMAQHAGCCVSALRNRRQSGTAQAVRFAVEEDIPVHNLLDSALLPELLERHSERIFLYADK